MKSAKRTRALPEDGLQNFKQDGLSDRERQALRQLLAEGLADMAEIYRDIEREFNITDEELHRAVAF